MQGHVRLAVGGWLSEGVGIDAEDAEVGGLAGPHPVVGIAAELTQRLRYGEDQTDVGILLVLIQVEYLAAIKSLAVADDALATFLLGTELCTGGYAVHDSSDVISVYLCFLLCLQVFALAGIDAVELVVHLLRDINGALPDLHKDILGRTLLGVGTGHKAVAQDVILGGGELLDGAEAAMVVGKEQAVGTDDDARAVVGEIDHTVLQAGAVLAIELFVGQLQSQAASHGHRLGVGLAQEPHALVGTDGRTHMK